jgi:hypothetical protein
MVSNLIDLLVPFIAIVDSASSSHNGASIERRRSAGWFRRAR